MDKTVVMVGNGNDIDDNSAHDTTQFDIVVSCVEFGFNDKPSFMFCNSQWRRLLNPLHFMLKGIIPFFLLLLPPTSSSKLSLSLLGNSNMFVFQVLPLPLPPSATTTPTTQTLIFLNCAFLGTWTVA